MQDFAEESVITAGAGRRARMKKRHSGEGARSSRPQMHGGRRSKRRTYRQDRFARRVGDGGEGGEQRQRWRWGGSHGVGVTMRIRQAGGGEGGTRSATAVGVRTTRATTTDGGGGVCPGAFWDRVSWNRSTLCCGSWFPPRTDRSWVAYARLSLLNDFLILLMWIEETAEGARTVDNRRGTPDFCGDSHGNWSKTSSPTSWSTVLAFFKIAG